jgi:hypothetical protein
MEHSHIFILLLWIGLVLLSCTNADDTVSILRIKQTIYDQSPKLRIRGSGFSDHNEDNIHLELAATGQSSLVNGVDYMLAKDLDGDGLILKLLSNRR